MAFHALLLASYLGWNVVTGHPQPPAITPSEYVNDSVTILSRSTEDTTPTTVWTCPYTASGCPSRYIGGSMNTTRPPPAPSPAALTRYTTLVTPTLPTASCNSKSTCTYYAPEALTQHETVNLPTIPGDSSSPTPPSDPNQNIGQPDTLPTTTAPVSKCVLDGTTLTAGSAPQTIDGTTYSFSPHGAVLYVDGVATHPTYVPQEGGFGEVILSVVGVGEGVASSTTSTTTSSVESTPSIPTPTPTSPPSTTSIDSPPPAEQTTSNAITTGFLFDMSLLGLTILLSTMAVI